MEQKIKDGGLSIIQPNKVTNARYSYTEREENILTLIIDAIQKHMTNEKPIQTDLFNQPVITVNIKELGEKSKAKYIAAAHSMMNKTFQFEYINPNHKTEEVTGVLITTIRNEKETPYLHLTINQWAVPYLVYVGSGVGFTAFNKAIAVSIPGEYAKRMYKLCKRWENKGGFSMSVNEFRKMFKIEKKYKRIIDLKRRVLDGSIKVLKEYADVYFSYSLSKVGGSRSYNQINFVIHGNNKRLRPQEKTDMYVFVYNMLGLVFPTMKSSKAQEITDKLAGNPDELDKFYQRMKRLKTEFDANEKSIEEVIKLIKYILKEDYGII